MKLKIYVMALAACRDSGTHDDDPPNVTGTYYAFNAGLTLEFSKEHAEATGIEMARRIYPESRGYHCQSAHVVELEKAQVETLLRHIDAGEFDIERDESEVPGLPECLSRMVM